MIVELVIAAGVLAIGGAAVGIRRARQRKERASEPLDVHAAVAEAAQQGLNTGDVVLYGPDEFWLASGLRLYEEGPVLSVFHCPQSRQANWLVCFGADAIEIGIMREAVDFAPGPVAAEVQWEGREHQLERRGSAIVEIEGAACQWDAARAEYCLLRAATGHLILVLDPTEGERLALHGEAIDHCLVEVLPHRSTGAETG